MTERETLAAGILEATAEIIAKGWTQHAPARDRAGEPVDYDDPHAVLWSLLSALNLATRELIGAGLLAHYYLLSETGGCRTLTAYNDHACHCKSDVLDAIHRAIETLEHPERRSRT